MSGRATPTCPKRKGIICARSSGPCREAFSLYSPEVWERFEIDELELRRRAVGLARLRMTGRLAEAAEAEREALRQALSAA